MGSLMSCVVARFSVGLVVSALVLLSGAQLFGAEVDKAGIEFFETKIRPVLIDRCYQCHSAKAAFEKKLKGGFRLDTRAGIRKGGETGPAVVPGDVKASLLISAIRREELEMPPKGKLPRAVINDFVKWVEMGAPDPREKDEGRRRKDEIDIQAGRQFWSFQPLKNPQPPQVKNEFWVRTPIDRFILAEQEKSGLAVAL